VLVFFRQRPRETVVTGCRPHGVPPTLGECGPSGSIVHVFRNIETVVPWATVRKEISQRQQLPAPVQLFLSRSLLTITHPLLPGVEEKDSDDSEGGDANCTDCDGKFWDDDLQKVKDPNGDRFLCNRW
jgi:hypothetical protein